MYAAFSSGCGRRCRTATMPEARDPEGLAGLAGAEVGVKLPRKGLARWAPCPPWIATWPGAR